MKFGEQKVLPEGMLWKPNSKRICRLITSEAIKAERLRQHLTQEELGARVGVKRSQISKLESGKCIITLPTMSRVFKALGIASATLDLGTGGKVALW